MDKKQIDLECPHCTEENTINLSSEIKCKKCDKPLINEKYKKPIISVMAALLIGGVSGAVIDDYTYVYRAPVKTEYKMVKTCIDKFGSNIPVRDRCFCAVDKMSGFLDAEKARFYSEEKLTNILNEYYESCK